MGVFDRLEKQDRVIHRCRLFFIPFRSDSAHHIAGSSNKSGLTVEQLMGLARYVFAIVASF